jgi:hypothetical protein
MVQMSDVDSPREQKQHLMQPIGTIEWKADYDALHVV